MCGAEGLVVVLFSLDLWEIFFLPTLGFELATTGFQILHSTTVSQWCHIFTSDNFRYLTLKQRDWWAYCFDCTIWEIFFLPTLGLGLGSSESQVLQSNIMPQWILVFTSHNFKYFTLDGSNWWHYGSDWTIWKIFFLPTIELKLETSGSQVQHSATESEWFWISLLTISFI